MAAFVALFVLGGLFAGVLFLVSKAFFVKKDERVEKIEALLPNANCGGCGFAGCADFAANLASGNAAIEQCRVLAEDNKKNIAEILGIELKETEKAFAFRACNGSVEKVGSRFEYKGPKDCLAAHIIMGGGKGCIYGCLGYGDCVRSCPFGAISIGADGLPVIERALCVGCGKCVSVCPRNILGLVPERQKVFVACSSHDFGKAVMDVCKVGCIGCGKCAKICPVNAIEMVDNLAVIDGAKCVACGKCVSECPTKAIIKNA